MNGMAMKNFQMVGLTPHAMHFYYFEVPLIFRDMSPTLVNLN